MTDDKPFNPFYIGPHPSKACAIPEIAGQQCSPNCAEKPTASGQHPHPQTAPGGGILIVGISGPGGGMANIYSTGQISKATGAPGQSLTTNSGVPISVGTAKPGPSLAANAGPNSAKKICQPYPCMETKNNSGPGCD